MKILSHNVRVWTRDRDKNSDWYWKLRMERISDVISQIDPDILCFQELSFPAKIDLFALGVRDPGRPELICTDGILSDHRPILLTE